MDEERVGAVDGAGEHPVGAAVVELVARELDGVQRAGARGVEAEGACAEAQRLRPDGSTWWCLYNWRPFIYQGTEAVIIWHHDITEQVRANELLLESEQRFHDFADSAADRFWETDEDHQIIYVSQAPAGSGLPRAEDIVGLARWDIDGMNPDPEFWRAHRADIAARRPFRDFRFRRTRPNGRVAHVRVDGKPVFDGDGTFKGYRGTLNDETELAKIRLEIEETLADSETKYRDLYENAPIPYYSVDPGTERFTSANLAALELFKTDLESLTKKTVTDFLPDKPAARKERSDLFQRMRAGEAFRSLEMEIRTADGTPKWTSISVDPIRDGEGKVVELRTTQTDITERKIAQAKAQDAHAKLQDAFESISGWVTLYDA